MTVGGTQAEYVVDIWSGNHPFFLGKSTAIMTNAGRVSKFGDRFGDSSVPIGVVVDDTGTLAFVAHANADVITEVHLETGQILRMLTAGKEPDGMGFSPLVVER